LAPFGFGCLAGLLLLARILPTTLLLVVALLVLGQIRYRRPILLLAGTACFPLIWAAVAWHDFGRVFPVPGSIKSVHVQDARAILTLVEARFTESLRYLGGVLKFAVGLPNAFFVAEPDPWIAGGVMENGILYPVIQTLAAVAAAIGLRHWLSRERTFSPTNVLLWLTLISLVGYFAIAMLVWKQSALTYFSWYLFDLPVILASLVGTFGIDAARALPNGRYGVVPSVASPILVWLMISPLTPLPTLGTSTDRWSEVSIRAALYLKDSIGLRPSDLVASRSCGVLGFVLPLQVVNMDGLANDAAFSHLDREGNADDYLRQLRPQYYVDANSIRTQHVLGAFADRLSIVKTFEFPGMHGYTIARFDWSPRPP
jgi:hypothetical protein